MAPKKLLTFPGSTFAPLVMDRCEAFVTKDRFCVEVEKKSTKAEVPFEQSSSSSSEAIPRDHQVFSWTIKRGKVS